MSNRVVDIVERCLRETFCMTSGCEQTALVVIAALEKEGYKVMGRDPTEEMTDKAATVLWTACDDKPAKLNDIARMMLGFAHDAAPRYGEPSG